MKVIVTTEPFRSESATKKQTSNAKIVFGSKGESTVKRLDELNSAKELVSPNIRIILDCLKKCKPDEMEKMKKDKSVQAMVKSARELADAKTFGTIITKLRALKIPKAVKDVADPPITWDRKDIPVDTPKVTRAPAHGNENRKLEYVKESKARFTQHLKDALMRERSDLTLTTDIKKTNVGGKKVATTVFTLSRGKTKAVVGEWARGGRAWHYEALPIKLSKNRKV